MYPVIRSKDQVGVLLRDPKGILREKMQDALRQKKRLFIRGAKRPSPDGDPVTVLDAEHMILL